MAQVKYFLKIDGIDGESTNRHHPGEIEVESFVWSEAHTGPAGSGGGGGTGKVESRDLQFATRISKSSPHLMIGCATGQHFKSAVLSARKPGGGQQDYLKIAMTDVTISSYQISAGQDDAPPMDHVSLRFATLEMSYREQKPDGTLGDEVKQGFDFVQHKKL